MASSALIKVMSVVLSANLGVCLLLLLAMNRCNLTSLCTMSFMNTNNAINAAIVAVVLAVVGFASYNSLKNEDNSNLGESLKKYYKKPKHVVLNLLPPVLMYFLFQKASWTSYWNDDCEEHAVASHDSCGPSKFM